MNTPQISIIVPVYKVAESLPDTIKSILAQTYKEFELILVDDGSPDKSGDICDEFAKQDTRVHAYHKANGGAGSAREYGVEKAQGKWIMFVDGDDTIPATTLSNLLENNINDYDITIGTINLNNKTLFKHQKTGVLTRTEYIEALLLGKTSIGPVAKLFKKELFHNIQKCPKHITNNEDLLMLISIATKANTIFITNDIVCYNYIFREGSASKSKGMETEAWLDLFDIIKNMLHIELNNPIVRNAFINYRLRLLNMVAVFKGYIVDPASERVCKIINESKEKELTTQELNIIKTIQSVSRQRILYYYNSIRKSISSFLKNLLKK